MGSMCGEDGLDESFGGLPQIFGPRCSLEAAVWKREVCASPRLCSPKPWRTSHTALPPCRPQRLRPSGGTAAAAAAAASAITEPGVLGWAELLPDESPAEETREFQLPRPGGSESKRRRGSRRAAEGREEEQAEAASGGSLRRTLKGVGDPADCMAAGGGHGCKVSTSGGFARAAEDADASGPAATMPLPASADETQGPAAESAAAATTSTSVSALMSVSGVPTSLPSDVTASPTPGSLISLPSSSSSFTPSGIPLRSTSNSSSSKQGVVPPETVLFKDVVLWCSAPVSLVELDIESVRDTWLEWSERRCLASRASRAFRRGPEVSFSTCRLTIRKLPTWPLGNSATFQVVSVPCS
mmetsp:Transcript_79132/g.255846  ORF Transcript_79132/g.255846 Transcript_79132/m.255846 type:complete len:356 (-) Transcript_79132:1340-2407(-)